MSCANNYGPIYVPKNLPWYERDDVMTWYDQCKWDDFLRDTDKHFRETKIVNFDIIHKTCHGNKAPDSDLRKYQMLNHEKVKKYPEKCRKETLWRAFRTDQKDLYFQKGTLKKSFSRKNYISCWFFGLILLYICLCNLFIYIYIYI